MVVKCTMLIQLATKATHARLLQARRRYRITASPDLFGKRVQSQRDDSMDKLIAELLDRDDRHRARARAQRVKRRAVSPA